MGPKILRGVIALGKAIDYLKAVGLANIAQHETELMEYVLPKLQAIDGFELYGSADPAKHAGIISFNLAGLHPHDTATALDMEWRYDPGWSSLCPTVDEKITDRSFSPG